MGVGMCMYRLTEVHGQEEQAPGGVGAAPMCSMAKPAPTERG